MAHVITTGALPNSTGSTANQQALTGNAEQIYIRVDSVAYGYFADDTSDTAVSTAKGFVLSTGKNQHFWPGKPGPSYIYWVATGTGEFSITEAF